MKTEKSINARTTESLIKELDSGAVPKWLFFWGHTQSKDGSLGKSCFSQWWESHPFADSGTLYKTAEHFMMAEKACLFGDSNALSAVLEAKTPALAKKIGRTVRDFSEAPWLEARWDIVVRRNFLKFSQHPELKAYLIGTGERILVEASPYHTIWGIGMAANSPDIEHPSKWHGLNLLGFALMEVRTQLKQAAPHES